jgi:hypothetical protein
MGGKHVNKRDTVISLPSHFKNSDFLYSVVNYSDFANNPNKDEIKELLQPRSPAFGREVASAFSGAGALRPCMVCMIKTARCGDQNVYEWKNDAFLVRSNSRRAT